MEVNLRTEVASLIVERLPWQSNCGGRCLDRGGFSLFTGIHQTVELAMETRTDSRQDVLRAVANKNDIIVSVIIMQVRVQP